ncbi:MAG: outer membrane beta-barrel protein, partial [Gelidibacter sp.]|nr:outer membrane beta-barrel protein [Gelidibacter sp.]
MSSNFKIQNIKLLLVLAVLTTSLSYAQRDTEKWKLQVALGLNNPIDNGKDDGFYSKYLNFPSINIGVQHMFTERLGAKLDFGYNRASNANGSKEFKLNYTRINAQVVYNFTPLLNFLPEQIAVVGHAGPGISITEPLGSYTENKYTYLNVLGGLEVHYGLSESLSVYADLSYALSMSGKNKYDYTVDGFSFNG